MGCSEDYNPGSRSKHFVKHMTCKKQFPLANEARHPARLLKDFLHDDSISCSSSSSGFKSLPRNQPTEPKKLIRAQTTKSNVSALRAMINAAKSIQFVKNPPSILPRSLSRRLLSRKTKRDSFQIASVKIAVTVKDIIRWKSFRDLQEEDQHGRHELPPPSHSHCSADTASSSPSSGSKGSSWCDSDFSSEWWWQGEAAQDLCNSGKKSGVGGVEATAGENANCEAEEEAQQESSPVSIIGFQIEQEKEEEGNYSSSTLNESLANLERTKERLMEKLRRFKSAADLTAGDDDDSWMSSSSVDDESETISSLEEDHEDHEGAFDKAWQLLDRARGAKCGRSMEGHEEQLLLDFFTEELMAISRSKDDNNLWKKLVTGSIVVNGHEGEEEEEEIMVSKARGWISRDREVIRLNDAWKSSKTDACIKAMDKEGNWNKFGGGGEEGKEVGLGIEAGLFDDLINGLMADIVLF